MIYISMLHPSELDLGVDRGKLYDYKALHREAVDSWVKDQDRWAALIKRVFTEVQRFNRLYLVSWNTNCDEAIALVYADGEDQVRGLVEEAGAWPDYNITQLTMPEESRILYMKGGDNG